MFTFCILAAVWAAWRVTAAALASLRDLPRSNQDMIFW